jgi:membrane protein YdbS with pleckstrin-like domain
MPDIFVNSETPDDIATENVANDSIMEPHNEIQELAPIPPQDQNVGITNAQKHAAMRDNKENLPGHTHNSFASYYYYPEKVDFENKDPEEVVILLVRRHPITNLPWLLMTFVLIIAPAFLSILPMFDQVPPNFAFVFVVLWYTITAAFVIEKFLAWFFNVNIVTDERIIDVDFVNLVYREVTDADIEQIQDVTVEMSGTIRTLFNYGDVLIQTASQEQKTRFEAISHPDRVAKILRQLRVEEQEEKAEGRVR